MTRMAFTMKLLENQTAEYRRRHDTIWPELRALLQDNGITDYSIFLDETSGMLFGVLKIENPGRMKALANIPLMKRWWTYMKDIMETNPDHSPVSRSLQEVFHMD